MRLTGALWGRFRISARAGWATNSSKFQKPCLPRRCKTINGCMICDRACNDRPHCSMHRTYASRPCELDRADRCYLARAVSLRHSRPAVLPPSQAHSGTQRRSDCGKKLSRGRTRATRLGPLRTTSCVTSPRRSSTSLVTQDKQADAAWVNCAQLTSCARAEQGAPDPCPVLGASPRVYLPVSFSHARSLPPPTPPPTAPRPPSSAKTHKPKPICPPCACLSMPPYTPGAPCVRPSRRRYWRPTGEWVGVATRVGSPTPQSVSPATDRGF